MPFLKCKGRDTKWGKRRAPPPILNLITSWKCVVNFMSWLLYRWETSPVPTETIKETSRSVRLEQVNKWPNSMLARQRQRWWWWWWWWDDYDDPLNRKLVMSYSQSGCFGKEKNLLPLTGFKPRTVQTMVQSLYQLSYPTFLLFIKTTCTGQKMT